MADTAARLLAVIEHGDAQHRAWLRGCIETFFKLEEGPTPQPPKAPEHWTTKRPTGIKFKTADARAPRGSVEKAVLAWLRTNGEGSTLDMHADLPEINQASIGSCVNRLRKQGRIRSIRKQGKLFIYRRKRQ